MKRIGITLFAVMMVFFGISLIFAIVPQANASHTPVTISGVGQPTIDGQNELDEWQSAGHITFPLNLPEGGTTIAKLFVMNDVENIYLMLNYSRTGCAKHLNRHRPQNRVLPRHK